MNEPAAPLGERLKTERERKGFSVQKAADSLHLDAWVIEALESGDYARMGPSVYGKGHMKRYAGLLGLPADEVLLAYEGRSSAPAPAPAPQASSLRMPASDLPAREWPWAPIGGAVAVAVLAAGLLWWKPWHARGAPLARSVAAADQPPPHALPDPTVPADAREATPPSVDRGEGIGSEIASGGGVPAAGGGPVAAAAAGSDEPVAGVGRARLRLSFSADSWVDVHDATGGGVFAGNGRANSVKVIAGTAPMKVYLGFASGVQLEVNNHVVAIGPQFVAGDVARFEAGADGVLRRDARSAAAGNPHPRG